MSSARLVAVLRKRGDLLSRILFAIVQVVAIGWFSPGRGLPLDDAWIHQVVGRTFAETGTLGYAPGEHGAAATSYLWGALLGLGFKLHLLEPSRWALFLNGLAAIATGQLLYSILGRARPEQVEAATWRVTSLATSLIACVSPNVLWFVCSGMEAMPFVALSLTAIWAATEDPSETTTPNGRAIAAGVAAGALALLRPEAAPLGGLLAAHALLRRRTFQSVARIAVPWLACVGLYVGSNIAKTGHALPSTLAGRRWLWFEMSSGLSRTDHALDFLDAWTTRLGSFTFDTSHTAIWILVAIAAYGALRLVRGEGSSGDAPRLMFAWALFHAAFYALLLPTPGHGGRYQPLTPLLFVTCLPLGAAFVLHELARIVGRGATIRFAWLAAIGLLPWIVLAAPIAGSLRNANALAVAHIQATEMAVGTFVNTLPEGAVASFDIGGSGYAARRRIFDLGGLSDPKTAALLESGRVSTWLEANRVRWVVLPQSYESVLPTFEDYRTRLHLAENPSLTLTPIHAFETPFDKWEPSIRATWNAAPKQVVYEVTYTSQRGPREVEVVPADVRRPIADPAHLVREGDRIVVEHMLATLAAWSLPVDLKLVPAPPTRAPMPSAEPPVDLAAASGPCTISLGWWGIAIDGCMSVGDPRVLQAAAYEHAGRYLDVGDIGGALRVLPHVVAQVRRRTEPRFHPPLAPLALPVPGGVSLSPMRAGRWGLVLCAGVLGVAIAIEAVARRRSRATLLARASVPVAALFIGILGCGQDNDVTRAIGRGRGAVEIAIANGGDVNRGAGRPPIFEAATVGDAEIVSLLIQRGARLDMRDPAGAFAIHHAARRGHPAVVALLSAAMTADGSPHVLNAPAGPRRRTPLHDAALSGSIDSVAILLKGGANPNVTDSFGQTPLHLLASAHAAGPSVEPQRSAAIAALLMRAGADPVIADARDFTALHAAATSDNVPLLMALDGQYLLTMKTGGGETALDVALRYGRDRSADFLIEAGAVTTRPEPPPLHQAARMDALERAAVLVANGADLDRAWNGKTALEIAVEHGSTRVAALLRERKR